MARMIEFHIPADFKPIAKCVSDTPAGAGYKRGGHAQPCGTGVRSSQADPRCTVQELLSSLILRKLWLRSAFCVLRVAGSGALV
jgi:hypothetical protein